MNRILLAVIVFMASIYGAAAQFNGCPPGFCAGSYGIGSPDGGFSGGGATAAVSCVSPTAPNGVVDLSLCSNAYYAAVIF